MIFDTFENVKLYTSLNEKFKTAFEYILKTDFSSLSCGRYNILGENGCEIYANVDEYQTKMVSKPEYHKKYIDIQFLISGEEYIGYCPLSEMTLDEDFNDEKDVGFGFAVVDYIKLNEKIKGISP